MKKHAKVCGCRICVMRAELPPGTKACWRPPYLIFRRAATPDEMNEVMKAFGDQLKAYNNTLAEEHA